MKITTLAMRVLTHFNMGAALAIPMWLTWNAWMTPESPSSMIGQSRSESTIQARSFISLAPVA